MTSIMNDIEYRIATAKLDTRIVDGKKIYMSALPHNSHVITREFSMIENSPAPLDVWSAQLDIIHENSYADAWSR